MAHSTQYEMVIWHVDPLDQYYLPLAEDKEVHGSVETVVKALTVKLSEHALSTVAK